MASRRSRSAAFTVAIERSIAPECAELGDDRLRHHARRDVGARWPACGSRRSCPPGRPGSRPGCRGTRSSRTTMRRRRCRRSSSESIVGMRLALEAQLHVGVVLEDREAVLGRQLEQASPLLERQRAAGRVLEVGDDVGEASAGRRTRAPSASAPTSMPSASSGMARISAPSFRSDEQRAVVGGRLHHHEVAGPHELLEQEGVGLHRPVGGDHLLGLHAVLLRDPGEQARVAGGRAVGEYAAGIGLEGAVGGSAQIVHGDDVEGGRAAGRGRCSSARTLPATITARPGICLVRCWPGRGARSPGAAVLRRRAPRGSRCRGIRCPGRTGRRT